MREKLKALYTQYGDILRYIIIGGVTTLLDLATFSLLFSVLGAHYQLANIVAWIVAVAFAFIGNKWVVFRSKTQTPRALLREALSFVAMRLTTLAFSAAFMYITVEKLAWSETPAKAISTFVVIVLNYVLSKLIVFRPNKTK